MELKPHEQRVVAEFDELDSKLNKLLEFMHTEMYLGISQKDRELLMQQSNAMIQYRIILKQRIERFSK